MIVVMPMISNAVLNDGHNDNDKAAELKLRIWDLVEEQEDLAGQQWLMEHCWEYGFVLRYPKEATDSTGIIYEPWHYRYVGTELAAELHELGLTVEEYLQMLDQA